MPDVSQSEGQLSFIDLEINVEKQSWVCSVKDPWEDLWTLLKMTWRLYGVRWSAVRERSNGFYPTFFLTNKPPSIWVYVKLYVGPIKKKKRQKWGRHLRLSEWFLWEIFWGWICSLTKEWAWDWGPLHSCSWEPVAVEVLGDSPLVWFSLSAKERGRHRGTGGRSGPSDEKVHIEWTQFSVFPVGQNADKQTMTQKK